MSAATTGGAALVRGELKECLRTTPVASSEATLRAAARRKLRRRLHAVARATSPPHSLLIQELLTHVSIGLEGFFMRNAKSNRDGRRADHALACAPDVRVNTYDHVLHLGDAAASDAAYDKCSHSLTGADYENCFSTPRAGTCGLLPADGLWV